MNKRYVPSLHSHKKYQPKKSGWKKISKLFSRPRRRRLIAKAEPVSWRSHSSAATPRTRTSVWWLSVVLCSSWVALLVYTPFFKITRIQYNGLGSLTIRDIDDSLHAYWSQGYAMFPANNYFLLNESRLTTYLKEKFYLNGITIKKIFPNSLEVSIEEKKQSVILDTGTNLFLLDEFGNSLKQLQSTGIYTYGISASPTLEGFPSSADQNESERAIGAATTTQPKDSLQLSPNANAYTQITQQYGTYPVLYYPNSIRFTEHQEQVLKTAIVKAALTIATDLPKQGSGAVPSYFTVDDATDRILTITNKPWVAYFKATNDIADQLNNLELILRDNKPHYYVDVRYGNRVYWK